MNIHFLPAVVLNPPPPPSSSFSSSLSPGHLPDEDFLSLNLEEPAVSIRQNSLVFEGAVERRREDSAEQRVNPDTPATLILHTHSSSSFSFLTFFTSDSLTKKEETSR